MAYKPNFSSNEHYGSNYLAHSNATRSYHKIPPRSTPSPTQWPTSTAG